VKAKYYIPNPQTFADANSENPPFPETIKIHKFYIEAAFSLAGWDYTEISWSVNFSVSPE